MSNNWSVSADNHPWFQTICPPLVSAIQLSQNNERYVCPQQKTRCSLSPLQPGEHGDYSGESRTGGLTRTESQGQSQSSGAQTGTHCYQQTWSYTTLENWCRPCWDKKGREKISCKFPIFFLLYPKVFLQSLMCNAEELGNLKNYLICTLFLLFPSFSSCISNVLFKVLLYRYVIFTHFI